MDGETRSVIRVLKCSTTVTDGLLIHFVLNCSSHTNMMQLLTEKCK